ncbi:MAG: 50S ribosome-binding GTPase [Magnetococcales bacterium]|nr:50S ribosome-binding GTPase [Magnetococcales bacterium]
MSISFNWPDLQSVIGSFSIWSKIQDIVVAPKSELDADWLQSVQQQIPVVWLLGKVQSGKSSIVSQLTHSSRAEVGSGFRACTKQSDFFDFPAQAPLVRFLDTRGLGEAGYDPTEDIAFCEQQAHLLLVVLKASDPQQESIAATVREIRKRRPDWALIVAQTCLHQLYPREDHRQPYPFVDETATTTSGLIPEELQRLLLYQRGLFKDVPGPPPRFVPVDFTLPEDQFEPVDYGLAALWEAIAAQAQQGLVTLLQLKTDQIGDAIAQQAHPHIMGYAVAAALTDAVPVVGTVTVPVIQGKLLHSLATLYGIEWDRRKIGEFLGCLGTGLLVRYAAQFGLYGLVKLIPVWGQTVGAAAAATTSFATTFALGKVACLYLQRSRTGLAIDQQEIARGYVTALKEAIEQAKTQPWRGKTGSE